MVPDHQRGNEAVSRRPIGVFDSGLGGLTVLQDLAVALPHEGFLYLGDTGRFPYGDRPPEELRRFSLQIGEILVEQGAKLLVVACNSATSAAADVLRERLTPAGVDVVTVVGPEALQAAATTRTGRVGVLATPATVASGVYDRALTAADPHVRVTSVPCPDLAAIIQGGVAFDQGVVELVRGYCRPLREAEVDTVVLGCTHYPLVRPLLQRTLGPAVTLVTAGAAIARRVALALDARDLLAPGPDEGPFRFLCTGDPARFEALGTGFLQMPLGDVRQIRLDDPPAVDSQRPPIHTIGGPQ